MSESQENELNTARARYAKDVNSYVSDYIRFADVKVGVVLTLSLAMVGVIVKAAPTISVAAAHTLVGQATFLALAWATAATAALTLIFCALALKPRTQKILSLNSFPDIAAIDEIQYIAKLRALDEEQIVAHIASHTWSLSKIAVQKYRYVGFATWALLVLVLVGFAAAIVQALVGLSQ